MTIGSALEIEGCREHRVLLAVLRATRADAWLTQRQLAGHLAWTKIEVRVVERCERRLDIVELRCRRGRVERTPGKFCALTIH